MNWTLAPSLDQLRKQVNELWPNRDKTSDGTIGDLRHQAEKSDHNPNAAGVVTAWDCDADLSPTDNVGILVAALQASRDPRIKYLIWNRQITVKGDISRWKPYHGVNAHQHHAHISVSSDPKLYNDASPWNLDRRVPPVVLPANRILQVGMTGDDVRSVQLKLRMTTIDGKFGPQTDAAVRAFQNAHNLIEDGKVGPNTKKALGL